MCSYIRRMEPRTLWDNVDITQQCWNWTGPVNSSGYGSLGFKGRKEGVHRISYEVAYGPFDRKMFVLHRCDNPRCVNPAHLFLGTQKDNMQDALQKGRCRQGFAWTKENNPNKGIPMTTEMRKAVSGWKQRPFVVVSPTGEMIHGSNLRQYCADHGLNQGAMWSLINGKGRRKSHKGYTRHLSAENNIIV